MSITRPCAHRTRGFGALAAVLVSWCASGCAGSPSPMLPASVPAAQLANLGWLLTIIGAIVIVIIAVLLIIPALRGWRAGRAGEIPGVHSGDGERWIVIGGIAIPLVILIGVFAVTAATLSKTSHPPTRARFMIEVTGRQWWWEVRYPSPDPQETFVTANEIHIPVGEPVALRVRSADVIHSFWVPQLQGKIDVIPGQTNTFWLRADSAGVYRGQCAEYCGIQHAHMALQVVAQPRAQFESWVAQQRAPAPAPTDSLASAGRDAFEHQACALCHAIQGTGAHGKVGPDLTHVASRLMLAAGTIPNTPGHLAGWIMNSQTIKPGNDMPQMYLDGASLHAIMAYLATLH
ncbi:MAG TPA: cytochrome c oxidase subunit II [Gemmatimonadaceae bacterium]|nr:cytochrome c oxidase subunit II [Gemmatimonadaceae bacterium]